MSRTALKLAEPLFSPEREQLATAIVDAVPVRAALDEARARAEAVRGALAAAVAAVPAAERAAEIAKAEIVANPHGPRSVLREARAKVAEAIDDRDIARSVAERIEADLVGAERAARYASERIEAAADAVVATSFDIALAAAEAAARTFAAAAFAAREIAQCGDPLNGERSRMMGRVETLNGHLALRGQQQAVADAAEKGAGPWRDARAALLADPSAPLPAL